jgi:hypothetical protein
MGLRQGMGRGLEMELVPIQMGERKGRGETTWTILNKSPDAQVIPPVPSECS